MTSTNRIAFVERHVFFVGLSLQEGANIICKSWAYPVPLPELYFDSSSYPIACIVFGDMAIVSLFLLLFF